MSLTPDPTKKDGFEPSCDFCGVLGWTVERYGRVTHKESCPYRTDRWHQGDPRSLVVLVDLDEDPGEDITEPYEPHDPETIEKSREHGIEFSDWKPTIPQRQGASVRDRSKDAITNALYALNPNQGEKADATAAEMWLRTTLPAEHPNYLDWAYVESALGWSYV